MKKKNKKIINNKIKDLFLNQKGMALLTTLIFIFILVTFAVALLTMTSNDTKLSALQRDSTKAFYIAEAGIQDAIGRLINGDVSDLGYENDTDWNVGNIYLSTGFNNTFTIKHRLAGNPPAVATNPATDKPYYIINSTGTSGRAKRKIEVVISLAYTSVFAKALIGCKGVTFGSNANTSSYSSLVGSTGGNEGDVTTTVPGADIILNSDSEIKGTVWTMGNLDMNSNAIVYESAYANGNISMYSNSKIGAADMIDDPYTYEAKAGGDITAGQIYGTVSPDTSPPPVDPEPCDPLNIDGLFEDKAAPIQGSNDNGELNTDYFNGTSYLNESDTAADPDVIGAGKYYLTGFETNADAIVEIHGVVTLYVNGDFFMYSNSQIKLAGGAELTIYVTGYFNMDSNTQINNSTDLGDEENIPSKVMVYSNAVSSDNDDYRVILGSNIGFKGVVYAPNAAVEIQSNAQIYGSIRGSFVSLNSGVGFSYDEELGKITGGGSPEGFTMLYWRELSY